MRRFVLLLVLVLGIGIGVAIAGADEARDLGDDGTGFDKWDAKITHAFQQKDRFSKASETYVKAIWEDYKRAHKLNRQEMSARIIYGVMPDIKSYDQYVGKYRRRDDPKGRVFIEVVKTVGGRYAVKAGEHRILAVAANKCIIFTTGDVVYSPFPQLGSAPYATLETVILVRSRGKTYMVGVGEKPTEKNELLPVK